MMGEYESGKGRAYAALLVGQSKPNLQIRGGWRLHVVTKNNKYGGLNHHDETFWIHGLLIGAGGECSGIRTLKIVLEEPISQKTLKRIETVGIARSLYAKLPKMVMTGT